MSEFSKRCRFLIDICETNVYQIAKRTGLDRTTLQKMVQGTRLPSQQFVEQFCDYLAINISDREELLRLFKIEKIGINVWARRQEVESLLRDFPMLRKKLEESSSYRLFSLEQSYEGSRCCSRRLSTSAEVIDAIRYVIMSISRCAAKGGYRRKSVPSIWTVSHVFPLPCRRYYGRNESVR